MERLPKNPTTYELFQETIKLLEKMQKIEPKISYLDALFRYQSTVLTPQGKSFTAKELSELSTYYLARTLNIENPLYSHDIEVDGVDGGHWVFTDHNPHSPYEK